MYNEISFNSLTHDILGNLIHFLYLRRIMEISSNSLTYDILGNLIHFPHLRHIRKSHLIPLLMTFWEI